MESLLRVMMLSLRGPGTILWWCWGKPFVLGLDDAISCASFSRRISLARGLCENSVDAFSLKRTSSKT